MIGENEGRRHEGSANDMCGYVQQDDCETRSESHGQREGALGRKDNKGYFELMSKNAGDCCSK